MKNKIDHFPKVALICIYILSTMKKFHTLSMFPWLYYSFFPSHFSNPQRCLLVLNFTSANVSPSLTSHLVFPLHESQLDPVFTELVFAFVCVYYLSMFSAGYTRGKFIHWTKLLRSYGKKVHFKKRGFTKHINFKAQSGSLLSSQAENSACYK